MDTARPKEECRCHIVVVVVIVAAVVANVSSSVNNKQPAQAVVNLLH